MTDGTMTDGTTTDGTMTDSTLPVTAILAAGLGMGLAGDQLLRASAGPGLNFFLLFVGLAGSVWVVTQSGGSSLSREASLWLGLGLLCGAALMWRGSQLVRLATFVAACTAFTLPALEAGCAWTRRAGVLDYVEALAGAGLYAVFGGVRLINRASWGELEATTGDERVPRIVRRALGGVLLALVPLVVFGALFMSADAVFAAIVTDFVHIDLQAIASHAAATAVLAVLACGYLVGVWSGTRVEGLRRLAPARPSLGIAEVGVALALVDLLFLGFVTVQFRYLFGGGAWVEVTPGLTYAAYARAGFFELVAAVALAIPWLLVTHALLENGGFKARSTFAAFAGVQLLLLLAIVASAIQRMLAYQAAYGLTELRVIVTAVLLALSLVVVWFGATVLRGHRDRFAFGGIVTAFLLVGALQLIDPAGWVARHNLDRTRSLGGVDAEYLASLGSDAAPLLVARLDELAPREQCVVAQRLLRRWGPDRPAEPRSFNWSERRARGAVGASLVALTDVSTDAACEEGEGGATGVPAAPQGG